MDQQIHQQRPFRIPRTQLAARKNICYCLSCGMQWGQGENGTEILPRRGCLDTCKLTNILDGWCQSCGISRGKQGRRAFFGNPRLRPEERMQRCLQSLYRGERSFGLCHDVLFARCRPLHNLWFQAQRAVPEGSGRLGVARLPGGLEEMESQDRKRRLRDLGIKIGRRLPDWRRPRHTREAPCSPRS